MKSKNQLNQKIDFSDSQIEEEINEQIKQIRERNLTVVEKQILISNLYNERKQQKKKQKILKKEVVRQKSNPLKNKTSKYSSDEEGQIHEKKKQAKKEAIQTPISLQNVSISNLGDHIRPLTLTRNRLCQLLNSRRFQELVKGCFVRYIDSSDSTNNYIIAQIVGVTEGSKEYIVNNTIKTKVCLKLQQTSDNIVTLSIQMISNQHPPGGSLQIQKWLRTNRNRIPTEYQLKRKLQEHNKLLTEQLSSHQIDQNILNKAKKIAELQEQPKEDITHLIDFIGDKIHNVEVNIEEEEFNRSEKKGDMKLLIKEKQDLMQILQKLKRIKDKFSKGKQADSKQDTIPKEKKYSFNTIEQKRKDQINQMCKARNLMINSYEGFNNYKRVILANHKEFDIQLE